MMDACIPDSQRAVQLIGCDHLELNEHKPVSQPGAHQILTRVEAVGLCYSDLKLLKQFAQHPRKAAVTSGIDAHALSEMPNYVPNDLPVVPGHEAVVRIVAVGPDVSQFREGERYLVQTDYRWLPTPNSNAAFGYNFEGALQEYVLMDERVITSPDGQSMLIPVPEEFSASSIALVEPWSCVENAYAEKQRRVLKAAGRCLVIGESMREIELARSQWPEPGRIAFATASDAEVLDDGTYDDLFYFGSNPDTVEGLFSKLAGGGLFGILQCGASFDRPIKVPVGRIHYGGIRIVGTTGAMLSEIYAAIPATAELSAGDKVNIVGAGGPMGTMHVIRALCQGMRGVSVFAGDLNDERLAMLDRLARPLAETNGCHLQTYNPSREKPDAKFDYIVIMVPVATLVRDAIATAAPHAIINIFAGIPANVNSELDLDTYIKQQLYFVGTSGSELADMKRVLSQVVSRQLDTDLSIAAVSGLDGAIAGIRAVEKNLLPGKIVVYPSCRGLPLTPLSALDLCFPIANGRWTRASEEQLLKQWNKP